MGLSGFYDVAVSLPQEGAGERNVTRISLSDSGRTLRKTLWY